MRTEFNYTKVNGKWAVTRKGDLISGYKPFEFSADSGDVNLMSDFGTKKAAMSWVEAGFPLDKIQESTGITKIIWARTLKEAFQVSNLPDAYLSE